MSQGLIIFLSALLGAAAQELSHWYDVRSRLTEKRYLATIKSRSYWIVTCAMIIFSAVATYVWHATKLDSIAPAEAMIFGAAFPLIFKKLVSAFGRKRRTLGTGEVQDDANGALTTYFRA